MEPAPGKADDYRSQRSGNDAKDENERKIVLNEGDVAEKVAGTHDGNGPENSASAREEFKAEVVHAGGASDKRRESTNDWNEAGKENGFAAVAHIERVSILKFFRINPTDAAVIDFVAEPFARGVSHSVS